MRPARLAVIALATLALVACGDDDTAPAGDAGVRSDGAAPPADGGMASGTDGGTTPGTDAGAPEGCEGGPLAAPIAGCRPAPLPSTGDPAQDCVDRINQLRWECQCLPPLQRWTEGEACASMHAEYDSTRSPHDGFRDGICSPGGSAQNECPGWPSVDATISGCLQQMWDEGPGADFQMHGHYLNMTSSRYSRVACGFHTTPGGSVWAVQNFQ